MSLYREHSPPAALAEYVECFWTRAAVTDVSAAAAHRVLPDGCSDVIFTFDGRGAEATAVGTMTRPIIVTENPARAFVGVRFLPGKATAFLGVPASELTDLSVHLVNLWPDAESLVAEFEERTTDEERIDLLARALLARAARLNAASLSVDEALRRIITSAGNLSIGTLASVVGVSRQHLAKRFAHDVGISPKAFARVVRLRQVLERVRATPDPDWAALALECGYYDQSHLIGEFREITGLTPEGWVAKP